MEKRLRRLTVTVALALFIGLPPVLAAAESGEDAAAFIAQRLKVVGLEVESAKSLGNSVFEVAIGGFVSAHDALRLKVGARFKPLRVKAMIIGKNLKLPRTPLVEAGFIVTLSKDKVILQSGLTVDKAVTDESPSDETGGLMIDDDA